MPARATNPIMDVAAKKSPKTPKSQWLGRVAAGVREIGAIITNGVHDYCFFSVMTGMLGLKWN